MPTQTWTTTSKSSVETQLGLVTTTVTTVTVMTWGEPTSPVAPQLDLRGSYPQAGGTVQVVAPPAGPFEGLNRMGRHRGPIRPSLTDRLLRMERWPHPAFDHAGARRAVPYPVPEGFQQLMAATGLEREQRLPPGPGQDQSVPNGAGEELIQVDDQPV